jgi:hypothetical protein
MRYAMNGILAALLVLFAWSSPVAGNLAQDDLLPTQDLILKITENGLWTYQTGADGLPVTSEGAQILGGVPQEELIPSAQALYEATQVQDVYIATSALVPVGGYYQDSSTVIQTRVLIFPDETLAASYLNQAFDAQVASVVEDGVDDPGFVRIASLPDVDYPVVGWTSTIMYLDINTGEPAGRVNSVRYLGQVGRVVVSALVGGPFTEFNADVALWVLDRQAWCVDQNLPCEPIELPQGDGEWIFIGNVLHNATTGEEAVWELGVDLPQTDYASAVEPESGTEADAAEPGAATVTVVAATANVRADPSASAEVVDVVQAGDVLQVTGASETADGYVWLPVVTPGGTAGWIAEQLVQP